MRCVASSVSAFLLCLWSSWCFAVELAPDKQQLLDKISRNPKQVIELVSAVLADGQMVANEEAEYWYVLSDAYVAVFQGDKALEAAQHARDLAASSGNEALLHWSNIKLAEAYDVSSNAAKGIHHAEQAFSWASQNKQLGMQVEAMIMLGSLQLTLGNYSEALNYFFDAYLLSQQSPDVTDIPETAHIAYFIALVHEYQREPELAIPYFQEAAAFFRATDNQVELSNALFGLGRAYWNSGKGEPAVTHYRESLAISEEIGDKQGAAYTIVDLVGVQLAKREALTGADMKEIKQLLTQSIDAFGEVNNVNMQLSAMYKLALAHRFRKEYRAGLAVIDNALDVIIDHPHNPNKARYLELKAFLHNQLGEFEQAYQTAKRQMLASREQRERNDEARYQQLRAEFELDKTEYNNQLLAAENARKQAELEVNKRDFTITILAVIVFASISCAIGVMYCSVKRQHKITLKLAQTDELTGLYNRRQALTLLDREFKLAARSEQTLCLAIADIDDFKQINDQWGHTVGDEVLAFVGETMRQCFRDTDIIGRIGGEEFLLVFPGGEKKAVKASIESFMQACATLPPELTRYDGLSVTFSIGLTNVDTSQDLIASMANADNLLYQAKAEGKCRVKVA